MVYLHNYTLNLKKYLIMKEITMWLLYSTAHCHNDTTKCILKECNQNNYPVVAMLVCRSQT